MTATRHQHVEARVRVELELQGAGNGWTNVSRDVFVTPGIQIRRGIRGNGIDDLVAGAGTCTFVMDNMRSNSAGIPGYYSTDNAHCRPGFSETIGVRVIVVSPAVGQEIVFLGTIDEVRLTVGPRGRQDAAVMCVDWMEQAAEFMLSGLTTQVNKRADELLTTLLATPGLKQPAGTSFDTGKDTHAFAFESIRDGQQSARGEIDRVSHSGNDRVWPRRDGVLRYENRDYRVIHNADPVLRLDNAMMAMQPARSLNRVVNKLDVTAHPRTVDEDYVVLYTHPERPLVAPSETITVRVTYTDTANRDQRMGAADVQQPVAGTDYLAAIVNTPTGALADRVATLLPSGQGSYGQMFLGAGASKPAAVADDNDNTYVAPGPNGGLSAETYTFGTIGDATDTSPVASVKLVFRIRHTNGGSVFYPRVRLNGIDLDLTSAADLFETGTPGVHEDFRELTRPGGGDWTVADVNAIEVGGRFNWTSEPPQLTKLSLRVTYIGTTLAEADRTADFSVVATAGGNSAEIAITNNGTQGAFLMRLQLRGKRIFLYDPVTVIASDAASITRNGLRPDSFDMPYQGDSDFARLLGPYFVRLRRNPRTDIEELTILGNRSDILMNAAVRLDVSSLIEVLEPRTGVSAKYWINGVDLAIRRRGLIYATWLLERADPVAYWLFGVPGRTEFGTTDTYGPLAINGGV